MHWFALALKLCAPIFLLVGALHLMLGVEADVLLGASLPAEAVVDAALDSQNRFYGVSFTVYGVLLYVCARDVPKYALVLRCLLAVFFAAGLARLVSIAVRGMPPPMILLLLSSELVLPPLFAIWLRRLLRQRVPSPA